MKKILLLLLFMFPYYTFAWSTDATIVTDPSAENINIYCAGAVSTGFSIFRPDGTLYSNDGCSDPAWAVNDSWDEITGEYQTGSWHFLECGEGIFETYPIPSCTNETAIASFDICYLECSAEENALTTMLDNAETGFLNTTGATQGAVAVWAGENLLETFMGSAVSVLYYLRYWILALTIIYLIVFFYRRITSV